MKTATETPRRADMRRHIAAIAHGDANTRKKKSAADNEVTVRTVIRWGTPQDAKGSPQAKYAAYLENAQDPWRLLASNRATVIQRTLRTKSKAELIERTRELHVLDALGEGEDNSTRNLRGVPLLDRATITERDAAIDEELAAHYRECAARGYTEAEVLWA